MDPRNWVDQLFTYGPYAVLALFVLWVAPAQMKKFRECSQSDREYRLVCGFVTVGCWLIVFAMVYYIWVFWPPRTVYLGSLGVHEANVQFYSASPHLYITSRPDRGNRLSWDYAIVAETRGLEASERYTFAYQWAPGVENSADFDLPLTLLRERRIDLRPQPGQPGNLLCDGCDPAGAPKALPRLARAPDAGLTVITEAQAQPRPVDTDVLIEWLASSNANLRAQARAQLRQMTPDELRRLLQTVRLPPVARQQIEAELNARPR